MLEPIPHMGELFRRVYGVIRPDLARHYARWTEQARRIPDPELRRQALASLTLKKFHLEGGLIYVAQAPREAETLVPLITAYQTLCDYLDNLCDRSTSQDGADFRQLHASLQDALTPGKPLQDYYAMRGSMDDGGYVAALVQTCQQSCQRLPCFSLVQPRMLELSRLYGDLQVHKHIAPALREKALLRWHAREGRTYPGLQWQEFAAATGSTLGLFELLCQASQPTADPRMVDALHSAYFPWICALHILLDYIVDLEEDRSGGDLNFVHYYRSDAEAVRRVSFIVRQARMALTPIPEAQRRFHELVLEGLIAFYLADAKMTAPQGRARALARELAQHAGSINRRLASLHRRLTGQ